MSGGLFQIAEPGESSVKEACAPGRVVGIDLGTTNSLVATIVDGKPVCIADARGLTLLPSAVRYHEGAPPVVGWQALDERAQFPQATIVSAKRFIGRRADEVGAARQFTQYALVDDGGPVVRFSVAGRTVTPIEVSAEILRVLRERAERELGGPLTGAVITVPAYFDDAQRQATKDAGRIAGLEVLRLVNEPTAAALAYGLDKRVDGIYAVYDLGGGTFDVSILNLSNGVFEVKSTAGDTALGGDDFDRAIARVLIEKLPALEQSPELLPLARRLKHHLTDALSVEETLALGTITLTRAELDEAIRPIIGRTATACRRAVKDAGIPIEDIDGIVLVGGATRVPAVRAFVQEYFKQEPLCDLNPDEVVALGAAVQADILGGSGRDDLLLLDVLPLSLGLETMGGVVEKLIHRNSTVPAGSKQTFTTYADNQTGFDLHVVQGERETVAECRSLGRFRLRGIPAMPAGMARLEVTFLVDADGILRVTAKELESGLEAKIEVKPSYGLSDEEIEKMLLDSYEHAETDLKDRMRIEAEVEAERILSALRGALAADGKLLTEAERAIVDASQKDVLAAVATREHRKIRDAIERLDLATKFFAERRMNRSLESAMAGKSLTDVERQIDS